MAHLYTSESDESRARANRILPVATAALLVGISYYIGTRIGFAWTPAGRPNSTFWPPNAILWQPYWWLDVNYGVLRIIDDGVGFDPSHEGAGLGLEGMRQRVRAVGGFIDISSTRNSGTRIEVRVPFREWCSDDVPGVA